MVIVVVVFSFLSGIATGYGLRGLINREGKIVESAVTNEISQVETVIKEKL